MRPSKTILFSVICAGLLLPKFTAAAETAGSRELLARYVVELQTAPDDQALRERIIRLERTLTPPAIVPEAAKRFLDRATTFHKEAIGMQGHEPLATSAYAFAISAYKEALLIAPWWPEAYYGLGSSLQESGRFDEAAGALNLYIVTQPNAAGASAAEDRLRAIAVVKRDQAPSKQ